MQPNKFLASLSVIGEIASTGICTFNFTSNGSRLLSILINSRSNLDHEKCYHSFVREIDWCIDYLALT